MSSAIERTIVAHIYVLKCTISTPIRNGFGKISELFSPCFPTVMCLPSNYYEFATQLYRVWLAKPI